MERKVKMYPILMPEELLKRLKVEAIKRGVATSVLIRGILRNWLEKRV